MAIQTTKFILYIYFLEQLSVFTQRILWGFAQNMAWVWHYFKCNINYNNNYSNATHFLVIFSMISWTYKCDQNIYYYLPQCRYLANTCQFWEQNRDKLYFVQFGFIFYVCYHEAANRIPHTQPKIAKSGIVIKVKTHPTLPAPPPRAGGFKKSINIQR